MAVQQNKKSPSKRGMHRAHDHLGKPPSIERLESLLSRVPPLSLSAGRES